MRRLTLILRTIVHLRPIQILARVWNRRPRLPVSSDRLQPREGVHPSAPFPRYYKVWDGDATFSFIGETHEMPRSWRDKALKKLWIYNLHYFDCLRQDGVDLVQALDLVLDWIHSNPRPVGDGWEPYPLSLRIVNWVKFLASEGRDLADVREADVREMERSLCEQARWLAKSLEYHLLANHLLANAKALVFAGWFFGGGSGEGEAGRWLRAGMRILRRELPRQVLADGIHFERSAMYHSIILEDLLDLVAITDDEFIRGFAARMLSGLGTLTAPDGRIALFNDAAHGIALPPAMLREYASTLGIVPDHAVADGETSGYVRIEHGDWTLIAKCGDIGPSYQPGHAHADSLTFELWHRTRKIVTDTGCDRYVICEERARQRSSAAHNVPVVDGANSSEVWASHRVARRARTFIERRDASSVIAICEYVNGVSARRTLTLTDGGLVGKDEIGGKCDARPHDVSIRFHIPSEASDAVVQIDSSSSRCEQSRSECQVTEGFGHLVQARCEAISARTALPFTASWHIIVG